MTATEAVESQLLNDERRGRLIQTGYHIEAYDPALAAEIAETGVNGESYLIGPEQADCPTMDEDWLRRRVAAAQRRAMRAVTLAGKATGRPHALYICKHCADELLEHEIADHLRTAHGIQR